MESQMYIIPELMEASKIESLQTSQSNCLNLRSQTNEDSSASSFNPDLNAASTTKGQPLDDRPSKGSPQVALTRNTIPLGSISPSRNSQVIAASLLKDKSQEDSLLILANKIDTLKEMERQNQDLAY